MGTLASAGNSRVPSRRGISSSSKRKGPEPLDDGVFSSTPDPTTQLPNDLNAADALSLGEQLVLKHALAQRFGLSGEASDGINNMTL